MSGKQKSEIYTSETSNVDSNVEIIDLQAICELVSQGNITDVRSHLLKNPWGKVCNTRSDSRALNCIRSTEQSSTPSSIALNDQGIVGDAIFSFIFQYFFSLPSPGSSLTSSSSVLQIVMAGATGTEDSPMDELLLDTHNCIFRNKHIINEYPDLILRSLLVLPSWHNIPWDAAEAILEAFHSCRILDKNAFTYISELRFFIVSVLNELQNENSHDPNPNDTPSPSSASKMKDRIRLIRHRLFFLTYLVVSPFFCCHEALFNQVEHLSLDDEDLRKYIQKKIIGEDQTNATGATFNRISTRLYNGDNRHLIIPFDLLPTLFSAMSDLEQKYNSTKKTPTLTFITKEPYSNSSKKESNLFKIIRDILLPPFFNDDKMVDGSNPTHLKANFLPNMLPSLLTVASECSEYLHSSHWNSLYIIISNSLHHSLSSPNENNIPAFGDGAVNPNPPIHRCECRGKGSAIGKRNLHIIPSDYAVMIRQCLSMLSILPFTIKTISDSEKTDIRTLAQNDSFSFDYLWESLIFEMYYAAAICGEKGTLATVETVLRTALAQLTSPRSISRLIQFIHYFISTILPNKNDMVVSLDSKSDNTKDIGSVLKHRISQVPKWVFANVLLLLFRAHSGQRTVFRLAASVIGIHERTGDPVSQILTLLTDLVVNDPISGSRDLDRGGRFGKNENISSRKHTNKHKSVILDANQWEVIQLAYGLRHIYYAGGGSCKSCLQFSSRENKSEKKNCSVNRTNSFSGIATRCAELVHQSLSLGIISETDDAFMDPYAASFNSSEVGLAWTQVAFSMLSCNGKDHRIESSILAILSIICVFWNVQASRQSIVRNIVTALVDNSIGKNSNQKLKYCILCQVLVLTIVKNQQAVYLNCDFTRKVDEGLNPFDLDHSLGPISDLLTNSSAVALSATVSRQLLKAFLPLASARCSILAMCQKNIASPMLNQYFLSEKSRDFSTRKFKTTFLALEGLCSLISFKSKESFPETMDEAGDVSLSMLRGMIYFRKPQISLSARCYLFKKLTSLAMAEKDSPLFLSSKTCAQLLRSCVCEMLQLFIVEQESEKEDVLTWDGNKATLRKKIQSSLIFIPDRCFISQQKDLTSVDHTCSIRDDVLALIKLVIALHQRLYDDSRLDLNKRLSQYQKLLLEIARKGSLENYESENTKTLDVICTACMSEIFLYTIKKQDDRKIFHNRCTETPIRECTQFQEYLLKKDFQNSANVQSLPKIFIKEQPDRIHQPLNELNLTGRTQMMAKLRSAFAVIFQTAVFGIGKNQNNTVDKESCEWNELCEVLLLLSRSHSGPDTMTRENSPHAIISSNSTHNENLKVAISFICTISNATLCIRRCERSSTGIQVSDEILWSINHNLCVLIKSIDLINNEQDSGDCDIFDYYDEMVTFESYFSYQNLISGIWKIYLSLCCEDKACMIIETLQEDNCCHSTETIDATLRKLRYNVLDSLKKVIFIHFHKFSSLHRSLSEWSDTESFKSMDFTYFQMVHQLSNDLLSGLEGNSGAITSNLYVMFLQTINIVIDSISFHLQNICTRSDCGTVYGYCEICEDAALTLWQILCNYNLKHSLLIKNTLKLSLSTLPLLSQRMIRLTGIDENEEKVSEPNYLVINVSIQCLHILKRWFMMKSSKENHILTWNEIVNSNSLDIGEISPQLSIYQNIKSIGRAQMNTSREWSWILECTFFAMEQNCIESDKIIQKKFESKDSPEILCESFLTQFCVRRKNELAYILNNLITFLGEVGPPLETDKIENDDAISKTSNLKTESPQKTLYVELLPDQGKARLCKCLERLSTTIKNACQCILKSLKESDPSKKFTSSLLESLICLAALLQSDDTPGIHNIVSATRLWYFTEKRKFFLAAKKKHALKSHISDNPILSRIPPIIFRMESFESIIQNIVDLVFSQDSSLFGEYDVLLSVIMEATPEEGMMLKLLKNHVNKSSSIDSYGMALILDMDTLNQTESNVGGPINKTNKSVGIKRRRNTKSLYGSHRQILRSRNEVVDEWLSLDRHLSSDEEEIDDAFVDLEDFLEEG